MKRLAPLTILGAIAVTALLVAGCGSSSKSSSNSSAAAKTAGGAALVSSSSSSSLGSIVVDGSGRTLYMFKKDTGSQSTCSGSCATNWPPLTTTGTPKAAGGISSSAVKTVKRSDGTMQVTLDGHPLYHFVGDKSAGDANGQGVNAFGAQWFALTPSGKDVSGSASSKSSSGGGAYGGY
jgi:predicted lipoprotein with Yx(FWY)xxD motif